MKAVALEYQQQIVDNNVTKDEALEVMEEEWTAAKSLSTYADALHKKATAAQRPKKAAQDAQDYFNDYLVLAHSI
mgnify:CR=1 FL=1